ncbi:E3 ubiquitin-protein ligase RSL1-like [Henckelia pumila]|uniref:E3 ubiquitin-protein ligase RSL1-like n=1 Tax=Henckelia pumila TaxID=405737 RepID=UPI003C6E9E27
MGNNITSAHINPPPHHPEHDDQEFTCEICFRQSSLANNKFKNGDECAHPFCTDCMAKYIRFKLKDERTGDIKCPAPYCDHTLDPVACVPHVDRSLFLRWCDVLCEAAVMFRDTCYCPYGDCNALILNECGGDLRRSECPKCKRLFCFMCKTAWHERVTCEENTNDEGWRRLAALKGWRRCSSCGIFVERVGSFPIVSCRCGESLCYLRRRDVFLLCVGALVLCFAVASAFLV